MGYFSNGAFTPKLFQQLKGYNRSTFISDFMSGIGVGIVALPLAIAFGIASGVTPEQGLITAILGGFFAALFGGSSTQISGPTGAYIILVTGVISKFGFEGFLVATILSGLILILLGFLKLGDIVKFIPYPIVVGFTSGIAIILFSSQAQDLFGFPESVSLPAPFFERWSTVFSNISQVNIASFVIVILTIIVSRLSSKFVRKVPGSLIAITITTLIVFIFGDQMGLFSIETIGDRFTIKGAIPAPRFPLYSWAGIGELLPSAFTIAALGAIESLLSTTVADGITGDRNNSNMELVGQGVANVVSPLFGGITVSGAIARTMTNVTNGGRTPVASIIHALLLLAVLFFLMPLVGYIPLAALAGVLVIVAYNMCEWRTFRSIIRSKSLDAVVMVVTFVLTVLVDLTIAIEVGLLFAALLFMRRVMATSSVSLAKESVQTSKGEELNIPDGVEVYEIDGPFFFGIANKLDAVMMLASSKRPKIRIIRMRRVPFVDATGLNNLELLIKKSKREGVEVLLSGVNSDVRESLESHAFISSNIKAENICESISIAIERSRQICHKCEINS